MFGIAGSSLMEYSGYCVQEHHGGICLQGTETGKMYTVGFAGGATREYRKKSWKP